MWTSEIIQKELNNGVLSVTVVYSSQDEKFQETYRFSSDASNQLNSVVFSRIRNLENLYLEKDLISLGSYVSKQDIQIPKPIL